MSLSEELLNVRKAYRILYAFQNRVKTIVLKLEDELKKHEFSYWHGPVSRPNSGTHPFINRWTWDAFPMHAVLLTYTPIEDAPNTYPVIIEICADDTTFDEDSAKEPDPERIPLEESQCSISIKLYIDNEYADLVTWDLANLENSDSILRLLKEARESAQQYECKF